MKTIGLSKNFRTTFAVLAGCCWLSFPGTARAHCDTMQGPVIVEAKAALEKGDMTPVLKWVKKDQEAEIMTAFKMAVAVRSKGVDARELADRYFLETLVRIHRAGEGAPYSGIKDEAPEPIVAMADKALAGGSSDEIVRMISNHMAKAIQEKFSKVSDAARKRDVSVEDGRKYVAAYVTFMHYVEGVHAAIAEEHVQHDAAVSETVPHER